MIDTSKISEFMNRLCIPSWDGIYYCAECGKVKVHKYQLIGGYDVATGLPSKYFTLYVSAQCPDHFKFSAHDHIWDIKKKVWRKHNFIMWL